MALVATLATTLVVGLAVVMPNSSAEARLASGPHQAPAGRTVSAAKAGTAAKAKVKTIKVDPRLFGVHDYYLNSLGRPGTGAIRLWDSGTTWADMQPTNGPIDFTRLDQIVTAAHRHHVEVTLVVANTPLWAGDTTPVPPAVKGAYDPPNVVAFKSFLTAVMQHYKNFWGKGKRGIANYQIWNEANLMQFWAGTYQQMGRLIQTASQVRKSVDPGAKLIGPSMVVRLPFEQKGISEFYKTKVGGKPVWKYVDALGFSLYPVDRVKVGKHGSRAAGPEDSIALLTLVKKLLRQDHVPAGMNLWNNEINYGLTTGKNSGKPAAKISSARQVANVMRTYLLYGAAGVKRVFWYAYDMSTMAGGGTLGNTLMTNPNNPAGGALTPAGKALSRIQTWMKGTLVGTGSKAPCAADKKGTYTCLVRYKSGVGRIYWNPTKTVKVKLVKSAKQKVTELGATSKAKGGSTLKVDYRPVLVKSAR